MNSLKSKYIECARAIYGFRKAKYQRRSNILAKLEMLPFEDLIHKHTCLLIQKCVQGKGPEYLMKYFNGMNSRTLNYTLPRVNSNLGKKAFYYRGPHIWNELNFEMKKILSENI